MVNGYILQFHTDKKDTFLTNTIHVAKVAEAYDNVVQSMKHHDDLVVRVHRVEFSDSEQTTLDAETAEIVTAGYPADAHTMIAAYVKVDGELVADINVIMLSLFAL